MNGNGAKSSVWQQQTPDGQFPFQSRDAKQEGARTAVSFALNQDDTSGGREKNYKENGDFTFFLMGEKTNPLIISLMPANWKISQVYLVLFFSNHPFIHRGRNPYLELKNNL